MPKKVDRERLLNTLATWCDVWEGLKDLGPKDAGYAEKEEAFYAVSTDLLDAYKATMPKDVAPHPGFDFYDVKVDNTEVPMSRCRNCGNEVRPNGVVRHYLSPACMRDRERRVGKPAS